MDAAGEAACMVAQRQCRVPSPTIGRGARLLIRPGVWQAGLRSVERCHPGVSLWLDLVLLYNDADARKAAVRAEGLHAVERVPAEGDKRVLLGKYGDLQARGKAHALWYNNSDGRMPP